MVVEMQGSRKIYIFRSIRNYKTNRHLTSLGDYGYPGFANIEGSLRLNRLKVVHDN